MLGHTPPAQAETVAAREVRQRRLELFRKVFPELNVSMVDEFMTDPEKARWLRVGQAIFTTNCVSCHGSEGAGVSGPNLTDDHYIRVRELSDVADTVIGGSIAAGMPAWKDQLSMNEIVQVSAYAASLRGGFVEGKEADGEVIAPWFPGGAD